MGTVRWRRSVRSNTSLAAPVALAITALLNTITRGPGAMRWFWIVAGAAAVVAFAEAWRAAIVVGSDGISVRRTFSRVRIPWADVEGFTPERRAGSSVTPLVELGDGSARALCDYSLPAAKGRSLLDDLRAELEAVGGSPGDAPQP